MTAVHTPPGEREAEFTLFGPGYGESIVLHIGDGNWVLVDSCIGAEGTPVALNYLTGIGVDPAEAVRLIVATHWHDDHIRGLAELVEVCTQATFCCPNAFCQNEFLTAIDALERRHLTRAGSGVREIHRTFSTLSSASGQGPPRSRLTYAVADRRLLSAGDCEIWSLSPDHEVFTDFLRGIRDIFPTQGETKARVPSLSPNQVAVALWVRVAGTAVLLGADVERRGWLGILASTGRPEGNASAVKLPHHGSENAHEPGMWETLLDPAPVAVLTPWARGGRSLPNRTDVERILTFTTEAYATTSAPSTKQRGAPRDPMVTRTIREFGIKTRRLARSPGAIRLRRSLVAGTGWEVDTFGSASHLSNYRAA